MTTRRTDRRTVRRLLELAHLEESSGLTQGRRDPPLRFGDVAVALGYVSVEDVELALAAQWADRQLGKPHRLLGEILVDASKLSQEQCDRVLDTLVDLARSRRLRPCEGGRHLDWTQLVESL